MDVVCQWSKMPSVRLHSARNNTTRRLCVYVVLTEEVGIKARQNQSHILYWEEKQLY